MKVKLNILEQLGLVVLGMLSETTLALINTFAASLDVLQVEISMLYRFLEYWY